MPATLKLFGVSAPRLYDSSYNQFQQFELPDRQMEKCVGVSGKTGPARKGKSESQEGWCFKPFPKQIGELRMSNLLTITAESVSAMFSPRLRRWLRSPDVPPRAVRSPHWSFGVAWPPLALQSRRMGHISAGRGTSTPQWPLW